MYERLGNQEEEELGGAGDEGARGTLWVVRGEHRQGGRQHTRIQGEAHTTQAGARISVLFHCDEKSHTL